MRLPNVVPDVIRGLWAVESTNEREHHAKLAAGRGADLRTAAIVWCRAPRRRTSTPRWIFPSSNPNCGRAGERSPLPRHDDYLDLVTAHDIRGLLHCHTDFSDGSNTLEEMAEATRAKGYEYFGVADHSKTASYAGGLSVERVADQHKLADELNARYQGRFRILKGIESDILEDGSLDYPDEVLAASTSSWRVSIAASGSMPRPKPSGSFGRCRTPSRPSSAT